MLYYFLLIFFTTIIFFLGWKIWNKTKEISIIIGLALIYYWNLLGSWFFIFDELTNRSGKNFGLHYYYIAEKLFPFHLDSKYFLLLIYYSLFIIVIELALLFFTKKPSIPETDITPIRIDPKRLLLISVVSVFISFFLVRNEIFYGLKYNISIYLITRSYPNKFFTLHQLMNIVSVISLYLGFITLLLKNESKYIFSPRNRLVFTLYIIAFVIVEGYLVILGNKREIFFAGIFGIILILKNYSNKIKPAPLSLYALFVFVPLILNDTFRKISTPLLLTILDYLNIHIPGMLVIPEIPSFSASGMLSSIVFSNEMFFSHFSMYGILLYSVPLTWGTSFISLFCSFIPRMLWTGRPPDIYSYYAEQVHAMPGQGYTINHASGWYLNFGVIGIIIGALLLGYLWALTYNWFFKINFKKNIFLQIIWFIAPAAFVAHIPTIIRSGPEVYKSLIIEAILIPALILFLSSFNLCKRFKMKNGK